MDDTFYDGHDELCHRAKFGEDRTTRAGCRYENVVFFMDARSASVHVIFYRCFFIYIFFILGALVGQTAERIFTKLSHVVGIRHHL